MRFLGALSNRAQYPYLAVFRIEMRVMRRQTHLVIGAIVFLAYTYPMYLLLKIPTNTMILGFFAVLFGSVMPDVLEPPRNWMHRGLGHSRRALKFSVEIFVLTAVLGLFSFFIPIFRYLMWFHAFSSGTLCISSWMPRRQRGCLDENNNLSQPDLHVFSYRLQVLWGFFSG
jgi:hypothetical protein